MGLTQAAAPLAGAVLLVLLAATPARAQWYTGVNLGGNHTQKATVTIEDPTQSLSVEFHDVHFAAPLTGSPYYSLRFGRMLGKTHRVGLEFEFVHFKVIADTSGTYVVTPSAGAGTGSLTTTFAVMNDTVQRYEMAGLNLALANVVYRAPLRPGATGRVSLDLRAGAGPAIPHADTTVLGESRARYQYAGFGALAGVGMDMQINKRIALLAEYKVTIARADITLAHGTGRTSTLTHHVTGGVIINLTR